MKRSILVLAAAVAASAMLSVETFRVGDWGLPDPDGRRRGLRQRGLQLVRPAGVASSPGLHPYGEVWAARQPRIGVPYRLRKAARSACSVFQPHSCAIAPSR